MVQESKNVQTAVLDPLLKGLVSLPATPGEKAHLIGCKCRSCNEYFFPKRSICPNSFKEETMDVCQLSRKGKLYAYTIARRAPYGFEAPYAVGYVDLPEKLRIFCRFSEDSLNTLRIGMEVELEVGPLRKDENGVAILGFKFRPV